MGLYQLNRFFNVTGSRVCILLEACLIYVILIASTISRTLIDKSGI